MKAILSIFLFLFILITNTSLAQSVRINFIRYKQIEYNVYSQKWESWPNAWNQSGAHAIIQHIYDDMYKVSVYGYDGDLIASTTCTFDSDVSAKKRISQDDPYLNCYSDSNGDQIWTSVVSLQSLIDNVEGWKQDNAQLYLWVFSTDTPFAFVLE
jgi:hypothetical protein